MSIQKDGVSATGTPWYAVTREDLEPQLAPGICLGCRHYLGRTDRHCTWYKGLPRAVHDSNKCGKRQSPTVDVFGSPKLRVKKFSVGGAITPEELPAHVTIRFEKQWQPPAGEVVAQHPQTGERGVWRTVAGKPIFISLEPRRGRAPRPAMRAEAAGEVPAARPAPREVEAAAQAPAEVYVTQARAAPGKLAIKLLNFDSDMGQRIRSITGGRAYNRETQEWEASPELWADIVSEFPNLALTEEGLALLNETPALERMEEELDRREDAMRVISAPEREWYAEVFDLPERLILETTCWSETTRRAVAGITQKHHSFATMSWTQRELVQKAQAGLNRFLDRNPQEKMRYHQEWATTNVEAALRAERLRREARSLLEATGLAESETFENPPGMNPAIHFTGPYSYQAKASNWLLKTKRGILALMTGMGKTFAALAAAARAQEEGAGRAVMFVDQARKMGTLRDIQLLLPEKKVVLIGSVPGRQVSRAERMEHYAEALDADIVIADYWSLANEAEELLSGDPFDVVINDESVALKELESQRTQNALQFFSDAEYIWDLSAYPFPNDPMDVWVTMRRLQPAVLGSLEQFRHQFCETKHVRIPNFVVFRDPVTGERKRRAAEGSRWQPTLAGYKNEELLRRKVAPFIFARTWNSADISKEMPAHIKSWSEVDMDEEHERIYNAVLMGTINDIQEAKRTGKRLNLDYAITRVNYLMMAASCPRLIDPTADIGSKYRAIARDAVQHVQANRERSDGGAVIFTHYHAAKPAMTQALQEAGVALSEIITGDTQENIDRFEKGEFKYIICDDSVSRGVNMHHGGSFLAHADLVWRPDDILQREGRIYRAGIELDQWKQSIRYMSTGSMDELIADRLYEKHRAQEILVRGEEPNRLRRQANELTATQILDMIEMQGAVTV